MLCLSQKTNSVFCTERSLRCGQRGTDHLVPDCMCAMLIYVPSSIESVLRPAMTASSVSKPNFESFASCLGIAINKKLTRRANAVN